MKSKLKFYKASAIIIILVAILLSAAFGIVLPFKTHPYFLVVATLYIIGTLILILAAMVCLATINKTEEND